MSNNSVEVEETYLYLDFNGMLDDNLLKNGLYFNVININKEQPILQIGNQLFKGTLESTVGTYLLFEEDKNISLDNETDEVFVKKPLINMKVCAKTSKILKLDKAYLENTDDNKVILKDKQFNHCPFTELLDKLKLGTLKLDDVPIVVPNNDEILFKKPAIPKRKVKPTQHHLMLLKDIGKTVALQQVKNKFSQNVKPPS